MPNPYGWVACGCENRCGDLAEDADDPNAVCQHLPPWPKFLTDLVERADDMVDRAYKELS
jgi:hypothetical protein